MRDSAADLEHAFAEYGGHGTGNCEHADVIDNRADAAEGALSEMGYNAELTA